MTRTSSGKSLAIILDLDCVTSISKTSNCKFLKLEKEIRHFRAADSFQRVLYTYPTLDCIVEIKARLGLCHQNMSNYDQALKVSRLSPYK